MEGQKERWMQLCEQAAAEQDTQKLLQLVKEINQLLEARQRSQAVPASSPADQEI